MIKAILTTIGLAWAMAAPAVQAQDAVVVGGKKFTEQQLVAEMTTQLIRKAGLQVEKRVDMGSSVLRSAQENGQIDIYWEYTGTSLIVYNKITDKLSPQEAYKRVKDADAAKGLTWLTPSNVNNTYALAMRQEQASKLGIQKISELAATLNKGQDLTFASNAEFYSRGDGLRPLQKLYGFEFARNSIKRMDGGLTYQALKDSQVDVALVLATDGRNTAFNFVVLDDDKGFFPSYAMVPVIRSETLSAQPKLGDILNSLSRKLDDKTMSQLNAAVDVDRKSVESVAEMFLKQAGLL